MRARQAIRGALVIGLLGTLALSQTLVLQGEEKQPDKAAARAAIVAKALSASTQRGLAYLVSQQHNDGGWGQGGGWRQGSGGRVEGQNVSDPSDLGSTCIATLALLRAGNTPTRGEHSKNVARAVEFICAKVDKADNDGLYVTDVRDTQLQQKIGPYVDTFLAGLVLSELKGQLPAGGQLTDVQKALDKTVAKIEKNQKDDGTFAGNGGWASVLSQGLASKFINRAAQNKVAIKGEVLKRDNAQAMAALSITQAPAAPTAAGPVGIALPADTSTRIAGSGRRTAGLVPAEAAGGTSAGVPLYFFSVNGARVSEFGITSNENEKRARGILHLKTSTPAEKDQARSELKQIAEARRGRQAAVGGIVGRLGDKEFTSGFGNNGGEEFLSYMNISEMLLANGDAEWKKWDASMTNNLERIQNQDGSWSGDHCITGRTFCTGAALLTLMADRAPIPLATNENGKQGK